MILTNKPIRVRCIAIIICLNIKVFFSVKGKYFAKWHGVKLGENLQNPKTTGKQL